MSPPNYTPNIPLDPTLTSSMALPTPPASSPNGAPPIDPAVVAAVQRFGDTTALAVQVVSLSAEVEEMKRKLYGKKYKKKADYILGGVARVLNDNQRKVRVELQVCFFYVSYTIIILKAFKSDIHKSRDGKTHRYRAQNLVAQS